MRFFPSATHLNRFVFRPTVELLEDRNAPDNLAPIAINDLFAFDEDELFELFAPGVLANDSDPDNDPITAVLVDGPSVGQLTFHANGSFTYVPQENYHGQVTFTYKAFDGINWSDLATVTLTINAVNDAPVALDDAVSTDEDTPITFDVLGNDEDVDGDELSIDSFTQPTNGWVALNEDQTFSYTPGPDWHGTDTFAYTISDGHSGTDTATVSLTVASVYDPPNATDDAAFTDEETIVIVEVLPNDDPGDAGALIVTAAGNGGHGTTTINPDMTVTYEPELDFFGEDSFTYTVEDLSTGAEDSATVWVTVYPVNDLPIAMPDTFTVTEDTTPTFNVLTNDFDKESQGTIYLTLLSVQQPEHGMLAWELNGDITYYPETDFSGVDHFNYTLWDGSGNEATTSVTINVQPVNDAPWAYNDLYAFGMPPDVQPPTFHVAAPGLLRNDVDYDFNSQGYVYSLQTTDIVIPPGFAGSLVVYPDGSFDYTPPMNFFGTTSFNYRATDGALTSDSMTVWLIVNPLLIEPIQPPPPPVVALDDVLDYDEEEISVGGNVLANDDNAAYAIVDTPPLYGRLLSFSGSGDFEYLPDPRHPGDPVPGVRHIASGQMGITEAIDYFACASDGRSDQAALRMTAILQPVTIESLKLSRWDKTESETRMDGNPNTGGGKRVFPDLPNPTNAHGAHWKTVGLKATVSPRVAGQQLFLWAYDVDDPSASTPPVDEDLVPYLSDNRTPFPGQLPWSQMFTGVSDAKGVVWFRLDLSMSPGDNYRMVVSLTEAAQAGFYPKHPDPQSRVFKDGQPVVDNASVKVSELLTVWRELHVERDHMEAPPANERFRPRGQGNTNAVGDDDPNPGGPLSDPSIALMQSEYRRAYIEARHDVTYLNRRKEVPWDHNIEVTEMGQEKRWMKDVPSTLGFWAIQMVGAYDGGQDADHDPNWGGPGGGGEGARIGRTAVSEESLEPIGGDGPSYIFLETIDDFHTHLQASWQQLNPATTAKATERAVLHESMHHFSGLKAHSEPPNPVNNPTDQGPMDATNNSFGSDADNQITPAQLHLMRSDPLPG